MMTCGVPGQDGGPLWQHPAANPASLAGRRRASVRARRHDPTIFPPAAPDSHLGGRRGRRPTPAPGVYGAQPSPRTVLPRHYRLLSAHFARVRHPVSTSRRGSLLPLSHARAVTHHSDRRLDRRSRTTLEQPRPMMRSAWVCLRAGRGRAGRRRAARKSCAGAPGRRRSRVDVRAAPRRETLDRPLALSVRPCARPARGMLAVGVQRSPGERSW
jgi:hypothetical protein